MNAEDPRSKAQLQAAATRQASGPSIKLLSRPGSPHLVAATPDNRFGPAGIVRRLSGYDTNHPPPALPAGAQGAILQPLTVEQGCDVLAEDLCNPPFKLPRARLRGARAVLERLMSYPGETWEQRWLASGFDAAARSWMDHFDLPACAFGPLAQLGMNILLQVRALRPSYSAGCSTPAPR